MDLECIMLNEISQRKKGKSVWYHLYVEPKKYNELVTITKKKQTLLYREQTSGYQKGEELNRIGELRGTNYYV